MTHLRPTALLLLGLFLAAPAAALPSLPALPTPPVAAGQDLQTPVGGAQFGLQGHAIDACANAAAPEVPVPVPMPLPVPVAAPDAGACIHADLDARTASLGAHAGPASANADLNGVDVTAGPVQSHTETPIEAFLGWLAGLF